MFWHCQKQPQTLNNGHFHNVSATKMQGEPNCALQQSINQSISRTTFPTCSGGLRLEPVTLSVFAAQKPVANRIYFCCFSIYFCWLFLVPPLSCSTDTTAFILKTWFPPALQMSAYLTPIVISKMGQVFSGARDIMKWLADCASVSFSPQFKFSIINLYTAVKW